MLRRVGTWNFTSAYEWSRPIKYRVEPVWPGTKSTRKAKPGLTLKVVEQMVDHTGAVHWINIRRCGWLPVKIGPKTMVVDEAPPSAASITSAAGVCRSGHPLVSYDTPANGYGCDRCARKFPKGASLHGCRACNFDLCTECVGGKVSAGSDPTARSASTGMKCKRDHPLVSYTTPANGYGCDRCESKFPKGTLLHGCRGCNYDLCGACAAASDGSAAAARTASPRGSGAAATRERAAAARRIAERKLEADARAAEHAQAEERTARALAAAKEQRKIAAASEAVRQQQASARVAAEATQRRVSAQRAAAKAAKQDALRKARAAAEVKAKVVKAKANVAAAKAAAQASRAAKAQPIDGIIHRNLQDESHRRSSYVGKNRHFSVSSAGKSLFLQSLGAAGGAGGGTTRWTAVATGKGAWEGSGGTDTRGGRFHAENPQIEINVKKGGSGKLAISVTQVRAHEIEFE